MARENYLVGEEPIVREQESLWFAWPKMLFSPNPLLPVVALQVPRVTNRH